MLLSLAAAASSSATLASPAREVRRLDDPGPDASRSSSCRWIHYFLALAGWSLCYFWIHAEMAEQAEHRHAMRAEAEALRAELEELRLQLDPHFLFNALNGVAEEIPEHPTAALAMLRDLTAYLRHSLDGINQTVVTVDAEVGGLSAYLARAEGALRRSPQDALHVDPAAAACRIASFLLQPLVENAVKHGRRENGLDVDVDIRLRASAAHRDREYRLARSDGRARGGAGPASASRTCAGGSSCTIRAATRFTLRERPDEQGGGGAGAGGRAVLRVLIVDDEHLARQAMRRLLAAHPESRSSAKPRASPRPLACDRAHRSRS